MIILLDCDGVLCQFMEPALTLASEISGKEYPEELLTNYFHEFLDENTMEEMRKVFDTAGYIAGLKPYPEAQKAVEELRKGIGGVANEIYCVTSPIRSCPTWGYERTNWLKEHFGIEKKNVILTSAKHLVRGDIFVDDMVENIDNWVKDNHGKGLLFMNQMNRNSKTRGIKVFNWDEILQEVEDYMHLPPF